MSTDLQRFDPSAAGFFDDPYPHYAQLREQSPVSFDDRGIACARARAARDRSAGGPRRPPGPVSGASDPFVTRERVETAVDAYRDLDAYVDAEVLPWKRRNRGVDLLSPLLAAEVEGQLSADELLDHVALLYVAGHETTSALVGNGILNLLRHPVVLSRGTMAFVCVASANRDPARFGHTADRLDITRADVKDALSLGADIHFCIGAPLARRETSLVIDRLFRRFPSLELAEEPRWNRRVTFRSLDRLLVALR
jgi:cytochrome P450